MEEKLDNIEKSVAELAGAMLKTQKNVEDLTEIVVSVKDYMEQNLATKDELQEELTRFATKLDFSEMEEKLSSKIDGLHRAADSSFERQSSLTARVTKIETGLHL